MLSEYLWTQLMSQLSFISFHDSLIFARFAFSGMMLRLTAILGAFVLFPVCERDRQQSLLRKAQPSECILFRKGKTTLCKPDPKPRMIEVLNISLPVLLLIFANPNKSNMYVVCSLACWGVGGREGTKLPSLPLQQYSQLDTWPIVIPAQSLIGLYKRLSA